MKDFLASPPALFAGAAVLSVILTGAAVALARRLSLLAHPVGRSSHSVPTPQVGGVGICLALLALMPLARQPSVGEAGAAFAILWLSLVIVLAYGLALGLYDDVRPLGAKAKLIALLALAAAPVALGIRFPLPAFLTDALGESGVIMAALATGAALVWVLFFVNAFNFMDGVNGQSGVFAIYAMVCFAAVAWLKQQGAPDGQVFDRLMPLVLLMVGAILGFLAWNFPASHTFLGDSGSLPLGAVFAILAVHVAGGSFSSFVGVSLVLSVYVYDVIYTLLRRLSRGENVLRAHRSHLYQRLLIATAWSHSRLLAFHLPIYLATGAAALLWHLWPGNAARAGILVAVAILLAAYTLFVRRSERRW